MGLDLGGGSRARPAWQLASVPASAEAPPALRSCAATWDATGERLIVFGGWNGVTHDVGVRTFEPATGAWHVLCDATSCGAGPAARRASQIVTDDARRRVLAFGGTNGSYFDDLWSLSLDTGTWTRFDSPSPRPTSRGGHSMVIDVERDQLWLFGGTRPGTDLGDLWRFDLATDTWHAAAPACPAGCPSPRSGATLIHDEANDRLVLYGGWESSTNTYHREAWTLDGLGWGAGVEAGRAERRIATGPFLPHRRVRPTGRADGDRSVVAPTAAPTRTPSA